MKPETGSHSSTPSCPHCGGPIPSDAPGGLCPRCVLLGAARPSEPAGLGGAASEPSLDEVRAAFPALEVVERLGAGGMGVVFKARQPALDRWVALKVLPRHLATDPAFTERFQREARLLARLSHPGIVAVHDFGQSGPFCYLLLEYVDGVTLRQAMRTGDITPAEALALVPRICEALQFAHDHGVLHRDIKPENILLDTAGRVKITDFGIAKLVGDPLGDIALTENGARLGTPHYMAPEQVEDPARVDHRADIYSLGVVFYELLTGELPLGRFAAPSMKSDLDARIDDIVLRALAKERELRQQSAGEVKTQVERLARNPEVPAPASPPPVPPTPPEGPAVSMTRLNWGVGLVAVSLVLGGPPVMGLGYLAAATYHSPLEWLWVGLTMGPAVLCGVVGTVLAELEVPAFRRNPALKVGRFRLMFALGTWPTVLAQFCAAVLAAGTGLLLTGLGTGLIPTPLLGLGPLGLAAVIAFATVVVVGILMPRILARHVSCPAESRGKGRVPPFQWLLHGGITVLFLVGCSGYLEFMVLKDREQVARQAVAQSMRPQPPEKLGTPNAPEIRLSIPTNHLGRISARLWRSGVVVPSGGVFVDIPGAADRRTEARVRWSHQTEGPKRDPDPSWTISVTEPRGTFQLRPSWIEGQPTQWEIIDVPPTTIGSTDSSPTIPAWSPILTGSGSGPVPWHVTLEVKFVPTPPGGLTAEQQELNTVRDQLYSLRQRATTDATPTSRGQLIDLEGREAYLRAVVAVVEANPAAAARAMLDHARAVLAFTEEEHRAGRATTNDLNRARTGLEAAVKNAGPAAGNAQ